jgi:site-specific recombinase XerD
MPPAQELLNQFKLFLQDLRGGKNRPLSAVTVKNYVSDVRKFLNWAEKDQDSTKLNQTGLTSYLSLIQSTFPASSYNRHLASINRFITFLSIKHNLTLSLEGPTLTGVAPAAGPLGYKAEGGSYPNGLTSNFRSYLQSQKLSHSTVKNYSSDLNHFITWSAKYNSTSNTGPVPKLTPLTLKTYSNYLKLTHVSQSVINRRLSAIKKFTTFALVTNLIQKDPFYTPKAIAPLQPLAWFTRPSLPTAKLGAAKSLYQTYNNWSFTPYLHLALLVLLTTALGLFGYNQIIKQAPLSQAYPTTLTPPTRQLSFQGRLTDSSDNPISTSVNVVFKLFDAVTSGSELYSSSTCSVSPDQDGIFNVLIGDTTCGAEIPSTVFSENTAIWLEVTVGAETLTPRQQIATVAYALNSETLQGYPAGTDTNSIPYIDNSGNIGIGATSPTINSTAGTFKVQGQALTLATGTSSDGNITLQPDGTGQILAIGGTTTGDTIRVTNANLTTGNLISGYVGNGTATGNLLNLSSGTSETDQFTVSRTGQTYIAGNLGLGTTNPTQQLHLTGDLLIAGDDLFMGTNTANYFLMADGTNYNPVTPAAARTGLGLDAGGAGDIWVEKAGDIMTGNLVLNDSVALALGTSSDFTITHGGVNTVFDNTFATGNTQFQLGTDTTATAFQVLNNTGTPLFEVDGSGNVGIGTTAPLSLLSVGTGTPGSVDGTNDLYVLDDIEFDGQIFGDGSQLTGIIGGQWTDNTTYIYANNATSVVVSDTGRIGIGTTAPGVALDVVGAITASGTITGSTLTDGTASITSGDGTGFTSLVVDNLTLNGAAITSDTGAISFNDENLTTTGSITGNTLTDNTTTFADTAWTSTGAIAWDLAASTTALSIETGLLNLDTTNSRVGIGTTAPSYKLDVVGTAGFSSTIYAPSIGAGTDNSVVVLNGSGNLVTDEVDSRVWGSTLVDYSGTTANYIPKMSDADTVTNSVMYEIASKIGLGTTAPTVALDVVGAITASGTITGGTLTDGTASITGGDGTGFTSLVVDNLTLNGAAITSDTGAISFNDENLTTTGSITGNTLTDNTTTFADTAWTSTGAIAWDLAASTTALNIEAGLLNLNTTNSRVGIGTTAPNDLLEIVGGSSGTETDILQLRSNFTGDNTATTLKFVNSTATSSDVGGGEISVKRDSTGGTMTFRNQWSGAMRDTMTLSNTGNLGIGTTNPLSLLSVGVGTPGDIDGTNDLYVLDDIEFDGQIFGDGSQLTGILGGQWTDNATYIYANNATSVVVSDTGNLGIGTTAPGYKLEVSGGDIYTSGDLRVAGDDLFMATNTANYFLMADGTNYNPVTPAAAVTGLGLDAGGAGDIWVEKAGDIMTGNLILNDSVALALGTSSDFTIAHGGTNTVFDNTFATGNTQFQIGTDTTATAFQVLNNTGTPLFEVDGSGNVGIGTTAPSYKLHVVGNGYFSTNLGVGGTANFSQLTASRAVFTDASSNLVSSAASAAMLNSLTDETGTGVAVFGTSPAITTSLTTPSTTFALINTAATTVNFAQAATTLTMGATTGTTTIQNPNLALSAASTILSFSSSTGVKQLQTGGTTHLALMPGGNVGIGTTAPTVALQVVGAITASGTITGGTLTDGTASITSGDGTGFTSLVVDNLTLNGAAITSDTGAISFNDENLTTTGSITGNTLTDNTTTFADTAWTSTGAIAWDLAASTTALNIETGLLNLDTSNSRVGIGTTSPTRLLDVLGDMRLDGQLYDENNSAGTPGQVLATTATGTDWIDSSGLGTDNQTLTQVLTQGHITGGNNISLTTTDEIRFYTDDADARIYAPSDGQVQIDSTVWGITGPGVGSGFTSLTIDNLNLNGAIITSDTGAISFDNENLTTTGSITGNTLTDNTTTFADTAWTSTGAIAWDLAASTTALNIETGLLNLDTTNSRVGIGTASPVQKLHVDQTWADATSYDVAVFGDSGIPTTGTAGDYMRIKIGSDDRGVGLAAVNELTSAYGKKQGLALYTYLHSDYGGTGFMERMRITNAGNVGIGTTAPSELLHLASSTTAKPVIKIENTNADNNPGLIHFVKNSASPLDGDLLGQLSFYGDDSGAVETRFATIFAKSADVTNATEDGSIHFKHMVAGTDTEVMTLTSGNVGIGTTAPTRLLDVLGDMRLDGQLYDENNSAGSVGQVLSSTATGTDWIDAGGGGLWTDQGTYIFANNSSSIVVTDTGRVGIGTTAPASALQVVGEILAGSGLVGSPSYSFTSSPTTGLYRSAADNIGISTAGVLRATWVAGTQALRLGDNATGNAALSTNVSTLTTPAFNFVGDTDTGIGRAGANILSLISGGTNVLNTLSTGRVGIGTTAPGNTLDIAGTLRFSADGSNTTNTAQIYMDTATGLTLTGYAGSTYDLVIAESAGGLLMSNPAGTSNLALVQSSGNVGIGTTNPGYLLEVAGISQFDNQVNFANGTTYYVDTNGNAKFNDLIAADTGNPGLTVGNGTIGATKIGSSTIIDNATTYLGIDPDSDTTSEFQFQDDGDFWSESGILLSGVSDSSTAVAFTMNTDNTLSTAGSKLLSVKNNGTEKLYLDADGNLFVSGTVISGSGNFSLTSTNASGGTVANRSIVILDVGSTAPTFTTTTTPYSKSSFGVVVGETLDGIGDDDGSCEASEVCNVAVSGEVDVLVTNTTVPSISDYLYTSDTVTKAVASTKQFDGLVGIVTSTTNFASGYVKMLFKAQPQVSGSPFYTKTEDAVTNGSYVEIVHNGGTNDIFSNSWLYDTVDSLWKPIDNLTSTYKYSTLEDWNDVTSSLNIDSNDDSISLAPTVSFGDGADGDIIVTSSTNINTTNIISGRTCSDGGDAVNYSVSSLTSTTATLTTTPSAGCVSVGDEILLINLAGTPTNYDNVGNYETLTVDGVASNVITFTNSKTKYYGNNGNDTNLGTVDNTQRVMLQRVPNYEDVTINTSVNLYPSAWNTAKGGVMYFKATGTVTITGNITADGYGYNAGSGVQAESGGGGGESFCDSVSATSTTTGKVGAAGGGGARNGASGYAGGAGNCGGGGGGLTGGAGSASLGGAGAGGGGRNSAGSGGGYGTFGYAGNALTKGTDGGTNTSGNGGANYNGASGGGGGTYGVADLSKLFLGSGGGGGGSWTDYRSGDGGKGGGIVYVAANTITVNGTVSSDGANGSNAAYSNRGSGGGGSGGSVKLFGSTVTMGSGLVTADNGAGGTVGYVGGAGGDGRIAVEYVDSVSGTTSPTATSSPAGISPYGFYHSGVIETTNAISYDELHWTKDSSASTKISFQTRSGNSTDPTDGTWEAWKPYTVTTNYVELSDMDTHSDWTGTNATLAEGDVTRNIDYFENEDEATATNVTKVTSSTNGGYINETISSTDLSGYDYITFWVRASEVDSSLKFGIGESAATEQVASINIETADTWQKVYWDISGITDADINAVTELRLTNLTTATNTFYLDSVRVEQALMEDSGGSAVPSTPNNYFQYRAIFTTTDTAYQPTLENLYFNYSNGYEVVQVDTNTTRLYNYSGSTQKLKLSVIPNGGGGSPSSNGLYTNTDATIADGGYIDVVHNGDTNDILTSGWKYNTTTSKWEQIDEDEGSATGGTITTDGDYTIHTFTSSGSFSASSSLSSIEYLVVGGGGAGGKNGSTVGGGGGGGGGFLTGTTSVSAGETTVTVGAGGLVNGTAPDSCNSSYNGYNGGDSVFATITADGGGGGGMNNSGCDGGSGGGATAATKSGGTATTGQGYNGGSTTASSTRGAGGGGASEVGESAISSGDAGDGGAGAASSISGSSVTYAGGGGGGVSHTQASPGAGGTGGGGAGGSNSVGADGTDNLGGGGGGGGYYSGTYYQGGAGGSGIVIVKYLTGSVGKYKIVQIDANTARLYNYSGSTQNLRLDVIRGSGRNSGTVSLHPLAADTDSNTDGSSLWINKTGSGGNLMKLQASGADKFTITAAGNVGIGTASPTDKLHIVNTSGSAVINLDNAGNGNDSGIEFLRERATGTNVAGGAIFMPSITANNNAHLYLQAQTANAGVGAEGTLTAGNGVRLILMGGQGVASFETGNVGIGTTSPGANLEVNYDTTGYLRIGSGNKGIVGGNSANNLHIDTIGSGAMYLNYYSGTGGIVFGNGASGESMKIEGSGNVGINDSTPSYKLDVNGTIRGYGITDSSDIRLKENITSLDSQTSLDKILSLQGIKYNWIDKETYGSADQIGFIAQDMESVIPELVKTDTQGYKSIAYGKLTAIIVEGIKEQQIQIATNSAQLASSSAQLASLNQDLSLTNTGDLVIEEIDTNVYQVRDTNTNQVVERVSAFAEVVTANFQAGLATITELNVDTLYIKGVPLDEYIISFLSGVQPQLGLNPKSLVSPLAYIDNLEVKEATVSGTLYAENIENGQISNIEQQVIDLTSKYSTASAILTDLQQQAELDLAASVILDSQSASTSAILTPTAIITDDLQVNNSLITNTINSNDEETLFIQPLANAPLNLMAGLMTLTPNGQVIINGDLAVTGKVLASKIEALESNLQDLTAQTATISALTTSQLTIQGQTLAGAAPAAGPLDYGVEGGSDLNVATSSASTVATATLPAGTTEVTISNTNTTQNTYIYLTPTSSTFNQTLFVKSKEQGKFTVAIPQPVDHDITFNYWLIKAIPVTTSTEQ